MEHTVVEDEPQAVVFVSDRQGAALGRRERCLKLAGITHRVDAERRPSGTYYKLLVHEHDVVAAHLALQMGGCTRSARLQQQQPTVMASLREIAQTLWEETVLLLGRLTDLIRDTAPRLLTGPR
jgi:hypothetical protein